MRCKDFLTLHSDFRDGIITDPSMERRMRRHLAVCGSCTRYAEALEFGVQVLRDLEEVEPSNRFRVNLRVRMALANRRRRDNPPAFGWPARAAVSLLVLTVIVTVMVERKDEEPLDTSPTRVVSNIPAAVPNQPVPSLGPPQFHLPAFHQQVGNPRSGAPRVTFSMSEDSGYRAVPATFSR